MPADLLDEFEENLRFIEAVDQIEAFRLGIVKAACAIGLNDAETKRLMSIALEGTRDKMLSKLAGAMPQPPVAPPQPPTAPQEAPPAALASQANVLKKKFPYPPPPPPKPPVRR